MLEIKVDEEENLRLDSFLTELDELELSRSYLKTLIKDEKILVNNQKAKASQKLKKNDLIQIEIPEAKKLDIEAEEIDLDIVFEDDDLIVINKQANLIVHPSDNIVSGTLVNALLHHCGDKLSSINGVKRPGIVHRLDKDTTGLMLVAKSDLAHKGLSEQIQDRTAERYYQAVVLDNIKENSGSIIRAIGRDLNDRKRMRCYDSLDNARYAKTNWKILKRLEHKSSKETYCLIECKLDTGRTHQIRVHMAYFKHPIIGDPVYGIEKNKVKATRPLLHSYKLVFEHPISKEKMFFKTELPDDFQTSLKFLDPV